MHKLKEKLMDELYMFEEKAEKSGNNKLSEAELARVHKLTDTVKNIDKIEMLEGDEGYSEDGHYMGEGRIYGTSYARGRGRNANRDRMGRYSSDGGSYDDGMSYARGGQGGRGGQSNRGYSRAEASEHLIEKAEDMLEEVHEPKHRKAIEKFIRELEND